MPGDLSIIGYDDSRFGRLPGIDLTASSRPLSLPGWETRVVMSRLTCASAPSSRGLCRACLRCSLRIRSAINARGTHVGAEEAGALYDLVGGSY